MSSVSLIKVPKVLSLFGKNLTSIKCIQRLIKFLLAVEIKKSINNKIRIIV